MDTGHVAITHHCLQEASHGLVFVLAGMMPASGCHYSKHGSWLNVAEIELSALASQCLDRRIASLDLLNQEMNAWQSHRNHRPNPIDWQFTTSEARIKLKRLYPNL